MSEALPNYRPLGSYWHTAVFSTTTSTEGAEQRSIYSLFHLDPENQITLKQRGDPLRIISWQRLDRQMIWLP